MGVVQWPVGAQFQMLTGFVISTADQGASWEEKLLGTTSVGKDFPFFCPLVFFPPSLFFKGHNNRAEFVLETGICPSVTGSCWYVFLGSHGSRQCLQSNLKAVLRIGDLLKQKSFLSLVYACRFPALCAGAGLLTRAGQWGLRGLLWQR